MGCDNAAGSGKMSAIQDMPENMMRRILCSVDVNKLKDALGPEAAELLYR